MRAPTMTIRTLLSAAALAAAMLPAAAAPGPYAVAERIALDAAGRWDYAAIDASHRRLYLSHGDHVDAVDLATRQRIGTIRDTAGVHGIAFAPEAGLGFTTNGASNSVTVFDLGNLAVRTVIALSGKKPDALIYVAAVDKLYVFDGGSNEIEIIDTRRLERVASIPTSGRPEFAVTDGRGRIYYNIEDHAAIDVVDTRSDRRVATWPLAGCEEPSGLAIDVAHQRLYSSCQNRVMAVTDAASGQRAASFAIGVHPDTVAFDAAAGRIITSCGGGTLSVATEIDADHYEVQDELATAKGAKTMAYDPADRSVYLPTAIDGTFTVLVAKLRPAP